MIKEISLVNTCRRIVSQICLGFQGYILGSTILYFGYQYTFIKLIFSKYLSIFSIHVVKIKLSFSIKPATVINRPGLCSLGPNPAVGKEGKKRGRITVLHHIKTLHDVSPSAETAAQESKLSKSSILTEYQDCCDKLGRFLGENYHVKLILTTSLQSFTPAYGPSPYASLVKADDVITEVHYCKNRLTASILSCARSMKPLIESRKVRLCLDPRDLNNNLHREYYQDIHQDHQ